MQKSFFAVTSKRHTRRYKPGTFQVVQLDCLNPGLSMPICKSCSDKVAVRTVETSPLIKIFRLPGLSAFAAVDEAYPTSIAHLDRTLRCSKGNLGSQISSAHLLSVLLLEPLLYSLTTFDGLVETSHDATFFPGL